MKKELPMLCVFSGDLEIEATFDGLFDRYVDGCFIYSFSFTDGIDRPVSFSTDDVDIDELYLDSMENIIELIRKFGTDNIKVLENED